VNKDIAGFYHDPPLWIGNSPVDMRSQDPPDFKAFSESMVERTLPIGIKCSFSRDGLFAFDFSAWAPGHFGPEPETGLRPFEESAELMLNQASVMNSLLVFLYSHEIRTARYGRERMVVTPELRLPLASLTGDTGMGFGNQSIAHLVMARYESTYRLGLPVSMDGRISMRGIPVDVEIVESALDDLSKAMESGHDDELGLIELFLRAGKAYQDHNHASAVIYVLGHHREASPGVVGRLSIGQRAEGWFIFHQW
jgi:hypothetical protein